MVKKAVYKRFVHHKEYEDPIYNKDEAFGHYNALSDYDKKCLVATNFWRIINEKPLIAVPENDKRYWSAWIGENAEARAIAILNGKKFIENRSKEF